MHLHFFKLIAAVLFTSLLHVGAFAAGEQASKEEAVAFVKKAIDYIKQNGKERAVAEFNNPQGKFIDRELYIVAVDLNGMVLAHGTNAKLAGKPLLDIKDVNGKLFVREQIDVARTKGKGWVDFAWVNPVSKNIEPRSTYLERVDDYFVLSGVFNTK